MFRLFMLCALVFCMCSVYAQDVSESYMDDLLKDFPEAKEEIMDKYQRNREVYSVPGFNFYSDTISFANFGLDDKSQAVEIEDFEAVALEKSIELNREMKTRGITIEDLEMDRSTESRNLILGKMGWAHCFAMSFLTKQFFEHATFTSDSSYNKDLKKKIERLADKKNTTIYGGSLRSLSSQHESTVKDVLMPLQKKLFFNFSSLGLLFGHDQKDAYKDLKGELKKQKLVLVGLKKSLSWQHVVLGFKVEDSDSSAVFYIYDCNYPSSYKTLTYNKSSKKFYSSSYGDITVFRIDR